MDCASSPAAKFPFRGTERKAQLRTEKTFSDAWEATPGRKAHLSTGSARYRCSLMGSRRFWSVWVLMSPFAQAKPLSKAAFDRPRIFTTKGRSWWKRLKAFRATTHLRALGEDYSVLILFCCRDMDLLQRRGLKNLKT